MAKPKRTTPIRTLDEYLRTEGAAAGDAKNFIRFQAAKKLPEIGRDERKAALENIDKTDPDLAKLRQLVHVATTYRPKGRKQGFFAPVASSVAARVLNQEFEIKPGIELKFDREADTELSRLMEAIWKNADKRGRVRCLNASLICVDMLSYKHGLALEQVIPIIRGYVGSPGRSRDMGKINPRAERIAQLTVPQSPKNDLKRVQELLDLFIPWEEDRAVAQKEADAARDAEHQGLEAASQARAELESAQSRMLELENEVTSLQLVLTETREESRTVKVHSSADVIRIRERYVSFLGSRISQLLGVAREAIEADPPALRAARQKLNTAIKEIEGELEWVRSSD